MNKNKNIGSSMTDATNPTPDVSNPASNADMEDILSSIKNTVEEETAKAEDVLSLDAADMVELPPEGEPAQIEERIDLDAFTDSGDVNTEEVDINKADILDEIVGVTANPAKPEDMPEAAGDVDVETPDAPLEENPDAAEVSAEDAEKLAVTENEETSPATPEEAAADAAATDDMDIDAMLDGAAEAPESLPEAETPTEEAPAPVAEEPADVGDVDIDALMDGADAPAVEEETPAETASEDAATPEAEEASDVDIDALMADAPKEEPAEAETDAGDVDIDALMDGAEEAEAPDVAPEVEAEMDAQPEAEPAAEPAAEAPAVEEAPAPTADTPAPAASMSLPASNTPEGLQVAFPSEVLAEALRPLVKGWVDQNLQGIVEKLVKEELERLAQG